MYISKGEDTIRLSSLSSIHGFDLIIQNYGILFAKKIKPSREGRFYFYLEVIITLPSFPGDPE